MGLMRLSRFFERFDIVREELREDNPIIVNSDLGRVR